MIDNYHTNTILYYDQENKYDVFYIICVDIAMLEHKL